MIWSRAIQAIGEIFFPPQCLACGAFAPQSWRLCPKCEEALQKFSPDNTLNYARQGDFFMEHFGHYPLSHSIRQLFVGLKYRGHPREICALLGKELQDSDCQNQLHQFAGENPLLIPVPLHRVKFKERGYNQAQLLANVLSRELGWEMDDKAVLRVRKNKQQASLDRAQRQSNAANLFRWNKKRFDTERQIVLVDDVMTSGATLCSMAQSILSQIPQAKIKCWTLVRAQLTPENRDFMWEYRLRGDL